MMFQMILVRKLNIFGLKQVCYKYSIVRILRLYMFVFQGYRYLLGINVLQNCEVALNYYKKVVDYSE